MIDPKVLGLSAEIDRRRVEWGRLVIRDSPHLITRRVNSKNLRVETSNQGCIDHKRIRRILIIFWRNHDETGKSSIVTGSTEFSNEHFVDLEEIRVDKVSKVLLTKFFDLLQVLRKSYV